MRTPDDWQEFFTERAAIAEHLGGLDRWIAERLALDIAGPRPGTRTIVPERSARSPAPRGQREDTQAPGPARCRSCDAAIVFALAVNEKGVMRAAPWQLDLRGEWTIERAVIVGRTGTHLIARHLGPAPTQLELGATAPAGPDRYTSHFATCPDAKRWRAKPTKDRT